jgi:D-glycero-alpha-D-manno-heptose 1-phosphate guanylyltransferase
MSKSANPRVTAVILAGGQGTRIRHLLPDAPKPMALVHGRPFIEWVVRFLSLQGIRKIIISTGYKAEMIAAHFESLSLPELEISCVPESEPQGTGGGFLQAISNAPAPDAWLVCNGDSLVLTPCFPLFQTLQNDHRSGALLGIQMADASNYGTLECDGQHILQRFAEKRPGSGLINAGVYLLKNDLVSVFPAKRPLSFEVDVFPHLLSTGVALQVVPALGPFLDIGTPETLERASRFIADNLAFFNQPLPVGHEVSH